MKITSVEVFDCQINKHYPDMVMFEPILIRINTDEGISGIGEVGLAYGYAAQAGAGIVRDLARCIIGMNPLNVEQIWEKLFRDAYSGEMDSRDALKLLDMLVKVAGLADAKETTQVNTQVNVAVPLPLPKGVAKVAHALPTE